MSTGPWKPHGRKLSIEDVHEIRRKLARAKELREELKELTLKAIAEPYGVSLDTISRIDLRDQYYQAIYQLPKAETR